MKQFRSLYSSAIALLAVALTLILSACGVTQVPPEQIGLETTALDDEPIWRAQIRLVTANVNNAGSDDDVSASLKVGNFTWLDYGRNDFERNTNYSYDLNLTGLRTFRDVTGIRIQKTGTDAWCIKRFDLVLNDRIVYSRSFPTCYWLDNGDGHLPSFSVSSNMLRTSVLWNSYTRPPLSSIAVLERAELESRIEGMVGHLIRGNALYWGHLFGRAVEVSRARISNSVHVDLDLAYDVPLAPDPEVDVDFDLVFSCSSGTVNITPKNVKHSVHTNIPLLGSLLDPVINFLVQKLGPNVSKVSQVIKVDTGSSICPRFLVTSTGDVILFP